MRVSRDDYYNHIKEIIDNGKFLKIVKKYITKMKPYMLQWVDVPAMSMDQVYDLLSNELKLAQLSVDTGFIGIFHMAMVDVVSETVYELTSSRNKSDDPVNLYNQVDHIKRNLSELLRVSIVFDDISFCTYFDIEDSIWLCTISKMYNTFKHEDMNPVSISSLNKNTTLTNYLVDLCVMIEKFNTNLANMISGHSYHNKAESLVNEFYEVFNRMGVYSIEQIDTNPQLVKSAVAEFCNGIYQDIHRCDHVPITVHMDYIKDTYPWDNHTYIINYGRIRVELKRRMLRALFNMPENYYNGKIPSVERNLSIVLKALEKETIKIAYENFTK